MHAQTPIGDLGLGRFVEIYRLEKMDENIFKSYQRYDFFQIIWFTSVEGDNAYFIDFVGYTCQSDDVVVIYPGQVDKVDIKQKQGYLFAVDKETYLEINTRINSEYLSGYFSNVFVQQNKKTIYTFRQLMQLILAEYEGENRHFMMETYMSAFIYEVAVSFDRSFDSFKQKPVVNSVTSALIGLIDQYYVQQQNTSFYASRLGLTNKKLNELTLQSFGVTVKQLLQETMLLAIKREIRISDKSMKEIAFDFGFEDPAYLTRFFKRHTGFTPSAFRIDRK